MTITTHSQEETAGVGRRLASQLQPGSVLLLVGDLGAGKTALVRGLAEGLGVAPEDVSSPTFALMQEYRRPIADAIEIRIAHGDGDERHLTIPVVQVEDPQLSVGRSTCSITSVCSGARPGSSVSPSCSCNAVKIDGASGLLASWSRENFSVRSK